MSFAARSGGSGTVELSPKALPVAQAPLPSKTSISPTSSMESDGRRSWEWSDGVAGFASVHFFAQATERRRGSAHRPCSRRPPAVDVAEVIAFAEEGEVVLQAPVTSCAAMFALDAQMGQTVQGAFLT